jgi:hypothetical protein
MVYYLRSMLMTARRECEFHSGQKAALVWPWRDVDRGLHQAWQLAAWNLLFNDRSHGPKWTSLCPSYIKTVLLQEAGATSVRFTLTEQRLSLKAQSIWTVCNFICNMPIMLFTVTKRVYYVAIIGPRLQYNWHTKPNNKQKYYLTDRPNLPSTNQPTNQTNHHLPTSI